VDGVIARRYFASAMLRPEEEIAEDVVRWLPRWAEVELDGERPVVAVWRDRTGGHRVIWYGPDEPSTIAHTHRSRYGDIPYWIVRFDPDPRGRRAAMVLECDGSSAARSVRWTFDVAGMPATETDVSDEGAPRHRIYHCAEDGWVEAVQERAPNGALVDVDAPATPPVPELTAEPYPCGAFMADRAIRVVAPVSWNAAEGRVRAVQQIEGTWRSLLVTFARIGRAWSSREQAVLSLCGDGIAPLAAEGWLEHPRVLGRPFRAIAELEPEGPMTVDEHILGRGAVSLPAACALVVDLADVAAAAHARGVELGGLRPELVYVRSHGDRLALASVLHRGPTFLGASRVGESIPIPPAFPADFAASDDVAALAQLLWYLTSGSHPFLAPGDFRWERTWTHFRNQRRRPQQWSGPPALAAVFDRFLFASDRRGRSLDDLRAALRALLATGLH
jgi:hypothetical protein